MPCALASPRTPWSASERSPQGAGWGKGHYLSFSSWVTIGQWLPRATRVLTSLHVQGRAYVCMLGGSRRWGERWNSPGWVLSEMLGVADSHTNGCDEKLA